MRSDAVIDSTGRYRYLLSRVWEESAGTVAFVMLNPSTADATTDDPTVRRCIGFARSWGFGGLLVANLFALRSTDPSELLRVPDPVGPANDDYLLGLRARVSLMVAAWGARGTLLGRSAEVRRLLEATGPIHQLGLTKADEPRHPLYLPGALQPRAW